MREWIHLPDESPMALAIRLLRIAVPVLLLVGVLLQVRVIVSDYRATSDAEADESIDETGTVESTEADVGLVEESIEATAIEEPDPQTYVVVLIEGLNFRTAPDGDVIDTLSRDSRLILIESDGGWHHVMDADGVEGWVAANPQYVRLESGQ